VDMVWLYHSPIPVRRRGVIYLFKLFLPAVTGLEGGRGGGGTPGQHPVFISLYILVTWAPPTSFEGTVPFLGGQRVEHFEESLENFWKNV
jgi:hypothetical protein